MAKAKPTKRVKSTATKKKTTAKAATPKRKVAKTGAANMSLTINRPLQARLIEKAGGKRAAAKFAMNAIENALGGG